MSDVPLIAVVMAGGTGSRPVSYTHLDVYKRQICGILLIKIELFQ